MNEILEKRMNVEAPGYSQQNSIPLSHQMPSLGKLWSSSCADSDLQLARTCVRDKIFQIFRKKCMSPEMHQKLPDIVRRLEERLLRDSSSKEEYMNEVTLEHRLQNIVRRINSINHLQRQQTAHHMNSSSHMGTMIPTPGVSTSAHVTVPTVGENSVTNMNIVTPSTLSPGYLLPATNGFSSVHGGSYNVSEVLPEPVNSLTGDIYGTNNGNMSASEGLYGPSTPVGSTLNSQIHSHHQQAVPTRTQIVDASVKTNFQISHLNRGHISQSQEQTQQFQDQKIQQQPCSQFMQHQTQKQHNQQHPLLVKNYNTPGQSQLLSQVDSQDMTDNGIESSRNCIQSHMPEQCQITKLQNKFQMQHASLEDQTKGTQLHNGSSNLQEFHSPFPQIPNQMQLQQIMHHCQKDVEAQNTCSKFSSRSQANILLPGQWKSQSTERFRQMAIDHPSINQNAEEQFHQRIKGDGEAQRPLSLLEGEAVTSFREATNQNVALVVNEKCDKDRRDQIRWLLFLCHARSCPYPEGACPDAHCPIARKLCFHMKECEDENCLYPRCCKSRKLIDHFRRCMSATCPVCIPVRQYLSAYRKRQISVPTNNTLTHQNGIWKSVDARDVSKIQLKTVTSTTGAFEDMQPSAKCMEVDHSYSSFAPMTENLSASVGPVKAPYSTEAQPHIDRKLEAPVADVQPAANCMKVDHSFPSFPPNEKPCASVGPVKAPYSMEARPHIGRQLEPPVEDVQPAAKRMKADHSYPSFTSMTEKPSARVGPVKAPYFMEVQSHISRKLEAPVVKSVPFEAKAKHVSANFGQVKSPKLSEAKNDNLDAVHAEKPSMDCVIQNELSKCDNVVVKKEIDSLKQELPQEKSMVLPIDPLSTLKSGKPFMDHIIQNELSKCDNLVINKGIDQLKQELPEEKSMVLSIDPLSPLKSGNPFMDCIIRNENSECDNVAINNEIDQLKQELPQEKSTALPTDPLSTSKSGKPFMDRIVQNELSKCDNVIINKEIDQLKQELPQEKSTALPTNPLSTMKSGKSKVKGVALTELFTPEQVREHIRSLRQWVGQSKAKAERNQAMSVTENENSCQLCGLEGLPFEPPPIYCSPCGARIKRNAIYYTTGTAEARHYFCSLCCNEARGDTIEAEGLTISKAKLEKKKNDEVTYEAWVQCDECESWQHQVCALFNGRRNDGGKAEYTCPYCYVREIENGKRRPLPQNAVLCAKDLPRTLLSDHIEQRLERGLKQERQERARMQGKLFEEVPGAESLVVRVVSSVDKKLEVKQRFLEIFREENYPTEFPYKSKVVLLFQKIEGVEVCLFGMFVQEFGSECQFPNERRVYLSYLDSVKYFRPEIKTVTGEALRTFVYHEILIGYLEYCKKRGFTSCYIWACPPLKGEDYILYCHPEIQKTPKSDKLREWYLSMLRKASKESIVADLTNLYDHFFVTIGECKAKVTAARLPYFDGDYWPGAAEDMINQLCQEDDGRKQLKKFKKVIITKRALKAAGHTDLSANASKDALLMQKLGETICPMKEDFIMVHLQHACTRCCHFMVSGKRWVCFQCKNFQLCDKCYIIEQKLEDRERHPSKSKEKHQLNPIEIKDVPIETKDKDDLLESEFFDTRQAFLGLCQGNHYQYETLRRAKHSSMMVLYHLHNPTAPAFVTPCNFCQHDIEDGQGWRCEVCPDFDVCDSCYGKDKGIDHPHKLTNHPSMAERDAQNKEARQLRFQQLRRMLELLVHASQCRAQCKYPNCRQVKCLFRHGMVCKKRAGGGCLLCKKMWYLLQVHARACKVPGCRVPRCKDLKEHIRRMQHQSESRRRAAVKEMMRQRAAEVARNS